MRKIHIFFKIFLEGIKYINENKEATTKKLLIWTLIMFTLTAFIYSYFDILYIEGDIWFIIIVLLILLAF